MFVNIHSRFWFPNDAFLGNFRGDFPHPDILGADSVDSGLFAVSCIMIDLDAI